jgi:hypothetical protein
MEAVADLTVVADRDADVPRVDAARASPGAVLGRVTGTGEGGAGEAGGSVERRPLLWGAVSSSEAGGGTDTTPDDGNAARARVGGGKAPVRRPICSSFPASWACRAASVA